MATPSVDFRVALLLQARVLAPQPAQIAPVIRGQAVVARAVIELVWAAPVCAASAA